MRECKERNGKGGGEHVSKGYDGLSLVQQMRRESEEERSLREEERETKVYKCEIIAKHGMSDKIMLCIRPSYAINKNFFSAI